MTPAADLRLILPPDHAWFYLVLAGAAWVALGLLVVGVLYWRWARPKTIEELERKP